jgi:hypothetical protein
MRRLTVVLGLTALCSALLLAPVALAGKAKEGWGPTSSWIGRYRVKVLKGGGVRSGELTMFIQEEFPGSEEPAGILNLRTKTNNDVVYLKELHWSGRRGRRSSRAAPSSARRSAGSSAGCVRRGSSSPASRPKASAR